MNNIEREKKYIMDEKIKELDKGLEYIGFNKEEQQHLSFNEVETAISNTTLPELSIISKQVGYIQGYKTAIRDIRNYFRNIASTEDAEGGGRAIYTSIKLEEMFNNLLK